MAINVDTVYKTVLLILNQQQRGYMTPDEFNKVGAQVQLNMFENYASDLNQQYRVAQNDTEYANRVKNINEKIDIFKKIGSANYNTAESYFTLPYADSSPYFVENEANNGTNSYTVASFTSNNSSNFDTQWRVTAVEQRYITTRLQLAELVLSLFLLAHLQVLWFLKLTLWIFIELEQLYTMILQKYR